MSEDASKLWIGALARSVLTALAVVVVVSSLAPAQAAQLESGGGQYRSAPHVGVLEAMLELEATARAEGIVGEVGFGYVEVRGRRFETGPGTTFIGFNRLVELEEGDEVEVTFIEEDDCSLALSIELEERKSSR